MNADGLAPPEVFVSYARKNRPVAEQLAAGLGASGLRVGWDSDLWAGAEFASVIEAQLRGVAVATRLRSFGYEAPGIELVGDRAPRDNAGAGAGQERPQLCALGRKSCCRGHQRRACATPGRGPTPTKSGSPDPCAHPAGCRWPGARGRSPIIAPCLRTSFLLIFR